MARGADGSPALRSRGVRLLENIPPVYCAIMRRRHPEWLVVDRRCDLVIEGYQSSGNTFARKAIEFANPGIRLGSHVHRWAHVAQAQLLRKPVLVLLRDPEDAIASHLVRMGLDDTAGELDRYSRFYRGVARIRRAGLVIGTFEDVTRRYGTVIRRINDRFGATLVPFDHEDPGATEAIFAEMEREMESIGASWRVARPREERKAATETARALLRAPEHRSALEACRRAYDALTPYA